MKKIIENKSGKKNGGALVKVGGFLNKHGMTVAIVLVMALMLTSVCFASGDPAETLWTNITSIIGKWVTRLGAVIIFVGGIMFALGWKSDDAEQKSRGISTVISGAMVTAIAALVGTFFA